MTSIIGSSCILLILLIFLLKPVVMHRILVLDVCLWWFELVLFWVALIVIRIRLEVDFVLLWGGFFIGIIDRLLVLQRVKVLLFLLVAVSVSFLQKIWLLLDKFDNTFRFFNRRISWDFWFFSQEFVIILIIFDISVVSLRFFIVLWVILVLFITIIFIILNVLHFQVLGLRLVNWLWGQFYRNGFWWGNGNWALTWRRFPERRLCLITGVIVQVIGQKCRLLLTSFGQRVTTRCWGLTVRVHMDWLL